MYLTSNRISLPFTCDRERPLSETVVYYSCAERLMEMRSVEYHTAYRTWVCLFLCVLSFKIYAEWRTLEDCVQTSHYFSVSWRCFTKTSHQHKSPAYIKGTIRAAPWSWLSWLLWRYMHYYSRLLLLFGSLYENPQKCSGKELQFLHMFLISGTLLLLIICFHLWLLGNSVRLQHQLAIIPNQGTRLWISP